MEGREYPKKKRKHSSGEHADELEVTPTPTGLTKAGKRKAKMRSKILAYGHGMRQTGYAECADKQLTEPDTEMIRPGLEAEL